MNQVINNNSNNNMQIMHFTYIYNAVMEIQPQQRCSHSRVILDSSPNMIPNYHRQTGARLVVKVRSKLGVTIILIVIIIIRIRKG